MCPYGIWVKVMRTSTWVSCSCCSSDIRVQAAAREVTAAGKGRSSENTWRDGKACWQWKGGKQQAQCTAAAVQITSGECPLQEAEVVDCLHLQTVAQTKLAWIKEENLCV